MVSWTGILISCTLPVRCLKAHVHLVWFFYVSACAYTWKDLGTRLTYTRQLVAAIAGNVLLAPLTSENG